MMFSDHEAEGILSALSAAQSLADIFDQKVYLMKDLKLRLSIDQDCIDQVAEVIVNKSAGVSAAP